MRTYRLFTMGTALVLVLSGCATIEDGMQQRAEAIPMDQRAYVAGSFRISCIPRTDKCTAPFNAISTYYRNVAEPTARGMTLNFTEGGFGGNTVADFVHVDREEKGVFFCHTVAAGDYSVFSFRYWNFAGGGSGYMLRETDQFDIPFSVAAGEVVYIGDIKQTYSIGGRLLGLTRKHPGVIALSPGDSEQARAATAKCPEAAQGLPVRQAPLQGAVGGHPLVDASDGE